MEEQIHQWLVDKAKCRLGLKHHPNRWLSNEFLFDLHQQYLWLHKNLRPQQTDLWIQCGHAGPGVTSEAKVGFQRPQIRGLHAKDVYKYLTFCCEADELHTEKGQTNRCVTHNSLGVHNK